MARKYRLNINGSPLTGVTFNGAAWQGNLNANGVEVSYEDTPYVPPPPPVPQPDTVWAFSSASPPVTTPVGKWKDPAVVGAFFALDVTPTPIPYGAGCLGASGSMVRAEVRPTYYFSSDLAAPYAGEWMSLRAKNAPISAGG